MELIKDRKDQSVFAGDYVLFSVPSSGMGQDGEMQCEKVIDKNGYGISVENYHKRFKVSHKIVKVSPEFALQFKMYTS